MLSVAPESKFPHAFFSSQRTRACAHVWRSVSRPSWTKLRSHPSLRRCSTPTPRTLSCLRPSTSSFTWTVTQTCWFVPATNWDSSCSTRRPTSGQSSRMSTRCSERSRQLSMHLYNTGFSNEANTSMVYFSYLHIYLKIFLQAIWVLKLQSNHLFLQVGFSVCSLYVPVFEFSANASTDSYIAWLISQSWL